MCSNLIHWEVIEEHFEEAEFLFELWQQALHSPIYNLSELEKGIESRLAAHIDGLILGGTAVCDQLLCPELEGDDPSRVAIAALALLQTGRLDILSQICSVVKNGTEDIQDVLFRVLVLSNKVGVDHELKNQFFQAMDPEEKAVWLEILSERYIDVGPALMDCFRSEHKRLLCAAQKSAGRSNRREFSEIIKQNLYAENLHLRSTAIEAGLLWGVQEAWRGCLELATYPSELQKEFLLKVALLGTQKDMQILHRQLEHSDLRESVLVALGFSGNVTSGDLCQTYLFSEDSRVAKLAAEALSVIGGFDLNDDCFQIEEAPENDDEEQVLPELVDDDLDEDLDFDGVDELPLPNPSAIADWWKQNRGNFRNGSRYLDGKVYSPEGLMDALEHANLRRRHAHAMDLLFRSGGAKIVSTDRFSSQQRKHLTAIKPLQRRDFIYFSKS